MPNMAFERDAAKARHPSTLRYIYTEILINQLPVLSDLVSHTGQELSKYVLQ